MDYKKESKFNFSIIGISPETDQQEFECSLEDFLKENQNGFTLTLDEMSQVIINAEEDTPIYEVSDKILVIKKGK